MKKLFKALICGIIAMVVCVNFTACSLFDASSSSEETTYTIQYTDDSGTHKIRVQDGELYYLESIPERTGYTFLGLFDAEVGGTQYVNSSGICLSAFTDKQNIVLYPQYQAKDYTIVLDYGEASVTGSRSYTVTYGNSLPDLPTNLTVSHKVFSGWYTEEDCGGTRVADTYGNIPIVSVLNSDNFEITSSTTYLYLYAGFTTETYTVSFNFGSGIAAEEIEVEYGTDISKVVTTTRNSDNFAVISWSLSEGGSEFTGIVTDSMVLYALEWAPCIDFNSNGGDSVSSIITRAGETISLPTPTRESYKFMYWAYTDGTEAELYEMPSASVTLKAVWQAIITFDENGGTDVDDISEAAGTTLTLPTPEKDGYIFAGWYTTEGAQYTSTKMPSTSLELKAGWYEEKSVTINQITGDSSVNVTSNEYTLFSSLTLDFSGYLDSSFEGYITIEANLKLKHKGASLSSTKTLGLKFYTTATISDSYKICSKFFEISSTSYESFTFEFSAEITGNKIYCAAGSDLTNFGSYYSIISDYYYTLTYPDTTTLYL